MRFAILISLVICASAIMEVNGITMEDLLQADSGSDVAEQLMKFLRNNAKELEAVKESVANLEATDKSLRSTVASQKNQIANLKATVASQNKELARHIDLIYHGQCHQTSKTWWCRRTTGGQ